MIQIFQEFFHDLLKLLPKLILAVIVLLFFWFISNRVRNFMRKKGHLLKISDTLITNFIGSLSKGLVMIIGFSIAMSILGLSGIAGGLITGAGVSAVVLGFAFKNVGENLISGVMLVLNRPFNTGDFISVGDITGTIVSMDLKTTDVRTIDGKMIYIPNTMIVNSPLTNYTIEGKRRFEFEVELDVAVNTFLCRELMMKALDDVPEIMKDPAPVVTLSQLAANLKLKAYYWLKIAEANRSILEINSEAIENCKIAFENAGIELADITDLKITNDKIPVDLLRT
jgi:small-conductance mechanosensitive channel